MTTTTAQTGSECTTDHLHAIARQVVARWHLGHDPVDCVHRALVVAASAKPLPEGLAGLSPALRSAALVLLAAPGCTTNHIAVECGISKNAAVNRCHSLARLGLASRVSHGRYRLTSGPAVAAPPDPYEQLVTWGRFQDITPTWVCERQGCGMQTACSRLTILTQRGRLERVGRGRYRTRKIRPPIPHRAPAIAPAHVASA